MYSTLPLSPSRKNNFQTSTNTFKISQNSAFKKVPTPKSTANTIDKENKDKESKGEDTTAWGLSQRKPKKPNKPHPLSSITAINYRLPEYRPVPDTDFIYHPFKFTGLGGGNNGVYPAYKINPKTGVKKPYIIKQISDKTTFESEVNGLRAATEDFQTIGQKHIALPYHGDDLYSYKLKDKTVDLFRALTGIIEYIQKQRKYGVYHLDLKLENITLNPEGKVHIIDYGTWAPTNSTTLYSRKKVGTLEYAPPEWLYEEPYNELKGQIESDLMSYQEAYEAYQSYAFGLTMLYLIVSKEALTYLLSAHELCPTPQAKENLPWLLNRFTQGCIALQMSDTKTGKLIDFIKDSPYQLTKSQQVQFEKLIQNLTALMPSSRLSIDDALVEINKIQTMTSPAVRRAESPTPIFFSAAAAAGHVAELESSPEDIKMLSAA